MQKRKRRDPHLSPRRVPVLHPRLLRRLSGLLRDVHWVPPRAVQMFASLRLHQGRIGVVLEMGLLELLALLVIAPLGCVAVVCSVGWWATVKPRLEHQEKMFALNEQAKMNAVTLQERQHRMLNAGRVTPEPQESPFYAPRFPANPSEVDR